MAAIKRYSGTVAVLAAASFGLWLGLAPLAGQAGGGAGKGKGGPKGPPAGPFTRMSDGKPDMQGYWSSNNFATAYDVEENTVASFEIPVGKGVVVDPPDGKIPYQPWSAAKKKDLFEHHLADDPQAHCFLSGVPRQMYTPFGFQILQPQGAVVLFYEAFHAYRIIRMDGKAHPGSSIKLFEGDSRGHWDGDALVVDVNNLNDRTWFDMAGNFHSDVLHVVERFIPVDANTINYEATIDDSKVYSRSWKIAFGLGRNRDSNYENLEYACVEGEQDLQHYTKGEGGKK